MKTLLETGKTFHGHPLELVKYSTHWMLRIAPEGKLPTVHTSKDLGYLKKLKAEYVSGIRV